MDLRKLEPMFDRLRSAPESVGSTRIRGLTHQIVYTDWRAVMESTHAQSQDFRSPERWNSVPVPARVAERALTNVDVQEDGCWISRYSIGSHGYAQVGWSIASRRETANGPRIQMVLAHRAAWTGIHGQVPLGMTLDHLCKVRRCVNPDHLRILPNYENARRNNGVDWPMGTCANGHSNEHLVKSMTRTKSGRRRTGTICGKCKSIYAARNNWRTRRPGQPFPDHLLLATERKDTAA